MKLPLHNKLLVLAFSLMAWSGWFQQAAATNAFSAYSAENRAPLGIGKGTKMSANPVVENDRYFSLVRIAQASQIDSVTSESILTCLRMHPEKVNNIGVLDSTGERYPWLEDCLSKLPGLTNRGEGTSVGTTVNGTGATPNVTGGPGTGGNPSGEGIERLLRRIPSGGNGTGGNPHGL